MTRSNFEGPTRVERPRLSDLVKERIAEMIRSGEFNPGDKLPSERDLMTLFSVGRPAVREALFALQKTGLVSLSNGSRPTVTLPSAHRMIAELNPMAKIFLSETEGERAFQNVRLMFEVALARHAAQHATKNDLDHLRELLSANYQSLNNTERFEKSDVAFHLGIAAISKNPIIEAVHSAIENWLIYQRRVSLMADNAASIAYDHHRRIYDAIASGNPDFAEAEMRSHLVIVTGFYWDAGRRD